MELENRDPAAETSEGEVSPIAQAVEQIMKNPELTGIINELRGGSGNAPPVSQTEILSHLPDVMAMLKPFAGTSDTDPAVTAKTQVAAEENRIEEHGKAEKNGKAVSSVQPNKYDKDRAEKLMAALKPYLSRNRCEIIDKCVSVIQITDIVEALRGLEGLTKPKP